MSVFPKTLQIKATNGGVEQLNSIPFQPELVLVDNTSDADIYFYEGGFSDPIRAGENPAYIIPSKSSKIIVPDLGKRDFTFAWNGLAGGTPNQQVKIIITDELRYRNFYSQMTAKTIQIGAIQAGTNTIGKVGVQVGGSDANTANPVPFVDVALGRTALAVTAGGAGTQSVKASAGKVWGVRAKTATVTVRDNATDKWEVPAGAGDNFTVPIACGTSIILNFSAAGTAYIIYE